MSSSWLNYVCGHHREWVNLVKSWGEHNYAEDIVQEMYLKLFKYTTKEAIVKDEQVNKSYVWMALRSTFIEYINYKKKITKISIDELPELIDESNDEQNKASLKLFNKQEELIDSWDWFDAMMFRLYRDSGLSMREIEDGTNISLNTIFNTIKNCKTKLKEELGEDYEDFNNEDYELI